MTDIAAINDALDIDIDSPPRDRTVDITTTGATTGESRRIEIWFHHIDGRWYLTGTPPRPRAWYRNLSVNPHFTFHLKNDVQADLDATARPITEPEERRKILQVIVDYLNGPTKPIPSIDPQHVEDWIAASPLVEVVFDLPAA
jgi:hypothetical protein